MSGPGEYVADRTERIGFRPLIIQLKKLALDIPYLGLPCSNGLVVIGYVGQSRPPRTHQKTDCVGQANRFDPLRSEYSTVLQPSADPRTLLTKTVNTSSPSHHVVCITVTVSPFLPL